MVAKTKNFEKVPKLNEEIFELEKKLAEKKQELTEKKEAGKHEKELIREIIKEKVEEAAVTPAPTPQAQTIKKIKEIAGEPKERQVQLLVNLALEKGIIDRKSVV
jgi:hypothetical protein